MAGASRHDLFSRGASPPISQSQQSLLPQQPQQPYLSHNNASAIDSLFQNSSSSSDLINMSSNDDFTSASSATTPPAAPLPEEPVSSPISNSSVTERQSALLSLLGGPSPSQNQSASTSVQATLPQQQSQVPQQSQQPQQVPTPPGSSQRSNTSPSHNEAQGKFLLEQLMAGNPPRSNYSDSQKGSSIPGSAPTPPYAATQQHEPEYRPYQHHEPAFEAPQQQLPPSSSQNQPPSPRKSMFDFVSPFDALSAASGSAKKKPPPPQPSSVSSANEDAGWTTDPKRQSVDNLLESLARIPNPASQSINFDPYYGGNDYSQSEQSRVPPPPLPPKPATVPNRTASPRSSPPKTHAQRARLDSPQGVPQPSPTTNRRDKESSPGPSGRGSIRSKGGRNNKNLNSPSTQPQNIVFDVSQPLNDIQAPIDAVKATAIALVRQEPVFLPGTTIGATNWVAYAMTKGRVRVISRSSGDRTLLTLPPAFPPGAMVIDMAVNGNRLAGVTSDGGFVLWELPEIITDDVLGQYFLYVTPDNEHDPLQFVKWHPTEPDKLAVASESQIYLLDLAHAYHLRGQNLVQSDLHHIGHVFTHSSPLVAFDFDTFHYTLGSISVDSTLTIWNVEDQLPYATYKVRGEEAPSSLTFVDGGIIIGRKNGTVFQLLSATTKSILSTIKFVNGTQEDPDMFGHVNYDSRMQTLWIANTRRESMIALKLNFDNHNGNDDVRGYFEQVVEFSGPKPTIHFVILTADADPNGDEAYAACVAAKLPPGELALIAFSVHSSGVDQILIRKEWFDSALASAQAKFPPFTSSSSTPSSMQATTTQAPEPSTSSGRKQVQQPPARLRTPPSEDIEGDVARDEGRSELKGKGGRGGKVKFGEERNNSGNTKSGDAAVMNESALGQAITREIRKTEENLHNRINKLLSKAMDGQNQRMEEARAHDQQEDFQRQETILKLISTELTRNTTRVVEMAVKNEVQNSVLPSLENITKTEVKAALHEQVGSGLVEYIRQTLPMEIEKLLTRPDISAHFSHLLSNNLTVLIDRHIKDAVSKNLLPMYSQQSSAMHQEFIRELRNEIHGFKAELTGWQNEALRSQESSIRDLERTVRLLSDQVKFLSMNQPSAPPLHHIQQGPQHGSPAGQSQQHLRQPNVGPSLPPPSSQVSPTSYQPVSHGNFPPPPPPQLQSQPLNPQWFVTNIAAPQASHPATIPAPPPQTERTPPIKPEQWDEIYLTVLHTQDSNKLRDLLAQSNPELVMPLNGPVHVSQAVILTLVHRLSALVGELPPTDESLKTSLWWLQRASALLRPEDKLITDFIARVIPNVQVLLNTTKQRLTIPIPGGPPTLDIARQISDIQESLRRKVAPVS